MAKKEKLPLQQLNIFIPLELQYYIEERYQYTPEYLFTSGHLKGRVNVSAVLRDIGLNACQIELLTEEDRRKMRIIQYERNLLRSRSFEKKRKNRTKKK